MLESIHSLWIVLPLGLLLLTPGCLGIQSGGDGGYHTYTQEAMEALVTRLSTMPDAAIVVNSIDGTTMDANRQYLDLVGYSLDKLKGMTYQDLTPAKWHDAEQTLFTAQVLVRGYSDVYGKEYLRKDGSVVAIENQAWLVLDENGEPRGLIGIVKEVAP